MRCLEMYWKVLEFCIVVYWNVLELCVSTVLENKKCTGKCTGMYWNLKKKLSGHPDK